MPDFGPRWQNPKKWERGGQAQTFLVEDSESDDHRICIAKVMGNPDEQRRARFRQELEICRKLDHPNIVKILDSGTTVKSKSPFFVMPYYSRGTLQDNFETLGDPLARFRIFLFVCSALQYSYRNGVAVHRDLKPLNIFVADDGTPVVGDFGLCYASDPIEERLTSAGEDVGARKYLPPEWREGRVDEPNALGDQYSLGKILYWLMVGKVYDGHEDDHHSVERRIAKEFWYAPDPSRIKPREFTQTWTLAFSLADDLVGRTVQKDSARRFPNFQDLVDQVELAVERVSRGGRVLDLNLPKRCLFCQSGTYQVGIYNNTTKMPDAKTRKSIGQDENPIKDLQNIASYGYGINTRGIPLILTCDYCGNVQYFRLDKTADGSGQRWRP